VRVNVAVCGLVALFTEERDTSNQRGGDEFDSLAFDPDVEKVTGC
jgi:hypothetical protein